MSDPKPSLAGLFVNKKASAVPGAVSGSAKPKNVKQRWFIIGIAAIGFIVVSSSFFSKKPETVQNYTKPEGSVLITPAGVDRKDWMSQSAEQLRQFQANEVKLKAQVATMEQQVQMLRDNDKKREGEGRVKPDATSPAVPTSVVPPPTLNTGTATQLNRTLPPPPPPLAQPTLPPTSTGGRATNGQATLPPGLAVPSYDAQPSSEPQVFKPEARAVAGAAVADGELVKSNISYKKNPYSGFLPAGSFAPVVLLNGLDAGTSSATQANPMPVLMTITDQATLPGSTKYIIKSCFVLGTGYGDLSAERVYVRYSRMSCVDKSDHLVLSADVSGYLVDSDGKIGLRGKIIDRQGAKLGKALLAGFAQGLAGALGTAQSTVTSSALGSTTSIGGGDALKASGLSGAQSATQQLAQFYLKEAQAIFPVISIDTGRTGTIVFTDNASLAWSTGDTQYVKDVRPN